MDIFGPFGCSWVTIGPKGAYQVLAPHMPPDLAPSLPSYTGDFLPYEECFLNFWTGARRILILLVLSDRRNFNQTKKNIPRPQRVDFREGWPPVNIFSKSVGCRLRRE